MQYLTSTDLFALRNQMRLAYHQAMNVLQMNVTDLHRTEYEGLRPLIARDMDECARLRGILGRLNQELREAQIREIQDLL